MRKSKLVRTFIIAGALVFLSYLIIFCPSSQKVYTSPLCGKIYTTPMIVESLSPISQTEQDSIIDISVGYNHNLALTRTGKVYAWGDNSAGQLGLGDNKNRVTPTLVKFFNDKSPKRVLANDHYSLVLSKDGLIYAFGKNNYSQLGDKDNNNSFLPHVISEIQQVAHIFSSSFFESYFALTENGNLYAWGDNNYGQLGLGEGRIYKFPKRVKTLSNIIGMSTDFRSIFVVNRDGEAYGFGDNTWGQLGTGGLGDERPYHYYPMKVQDLWDIEEIVTNDFSSFAITKRGDMYSWGMNDSGILGLGFNDNVLRTSEIPKKIPQLSHIKKVSVGGFFALAINQEGKVYAWGRNDRGQLGLGDRENRNMPTEIFFFKNMPIENVKTQGSYSIAITKDGKAYAWGGNESGQLGLGDREHRDLPTQINLPQGEFISDVYLGDCHRFIKTKDGAIYAWGDNRSGQLGVMSLASEEQSNEYSYNDEL